MIPVEHFGVHWAGPVGWLLQEFGGGNAIGLRSVCPFINPSTICNHRIPNLDDTDISPFTPYLNDPLLLAMLPIPQNRAYFLTDPEDDLLSVLACLSRMSSPIQSIVKPLWHFRPGEISKELARTNVQPLVVTQIRTKHQPIVQQISDSIKYLPRTIILSGSEQVLAPRPLTRIKTELRLEDIQHLPWEEMGASVLRRTLRKEPLNG